MSDHVLTTAADADNVRYRATHKPGCPARRSDGFSPCSCSTLPDTRTLMHGYKLVFPKIRYVARDLYEIENPYPQIVEIRTGRVVTEITMTDQVTIEYLMDLVASHQETSTHDPDKAHD